MHAKRKQERDYCIQYNKKKHDDNIDEIQFEMIFFYESRRQDLSFSVQLWASSAVAAIKL